MGVGIAIIDQILHHQAEDGREPWVQGASPIFAQLFLPDPPSFHGIVKGLGLLSREQMQAGGSQAVDVAGRVGLSRCEIAQIGE